jgi:hypothetical protein
VFPQNITVYGVVEKPKQNEDKDDNDDLHYIYGDDASKIVQRECDLFEIEDCKAALEDIDYLI